MLVMELWLSRAFSSSGSAVGSRTGDRCRFAGLSSSVFLFSTMSGRLLSTRFLFLGKNFASNLTGFLSLIFFHKCAYALVYIIPIKTKRHQDMRVCIHVITYLFVFTPSSPKALIAVLKMDSRASSCITLHASCRRIMSRLEIMLFGQSPA